MRRETKAKLDALERYDRWRRIVIATVIVLTVSAVAYVYIRPATDIGKVSATVERSVVGVDHWGQSFHQLSAKLENGRIVQVTTFLIPRALPAGERVLLTQQRGGWGNTLYRLDPKDLARVNQDR